MPIHEVLFVFVFVFVALNVFCFACRGFRYFQSIVWISPIAQVLVPQVRSFRLLPFSVSGNPKFIVSCTSNSLFVMSPHVFGVAPTLFLMSQQVFQIPPPCGLVCDLSTRISGTSNVLFLIPLHMAQVPPTLCFVMSPHRAALCLWRLHTCLRYPYSLFLMSPHVSEVHLLFFSVSTHVWGSLTLCFWCLHIIMSEVALLFVSDVSHNYVWGSLNLCFWCLT